MVNKESCLLTIDGHTVDVIRMLTAFFFHDAHTLVKYRFNCDNFITYIED